MTMTRSRRIWITVGAALLFFFVVLPGAVCVAARGGCWPTLEDEYRVVAFENQMPTDVTIADQKLNKDDKLISGETLGAVPAGQTENLTLVIPAPDMKNRNVDTMKRSVVDSILVTAEDSAGSIVWQKSWSMDDFYALRKDGWRIVISPETDEE